jgi:hypothetical protein
MEVLLAYAAFIIILAIPFLLIAAIAAAFLGGIVTVVLGLVRRSSAWAVLGVVLMVGSGALAITIAYWATTPPADGAADAHRLVYQTYQSMRARQQAMRWLRDGTFERLAKERQAQDAEQRPGDPPR